MSPEKETFMLTSFLRDLRVLNIFIFCCFYEHTPTHPHRHPKQRKPTRTKHVFQSRLWDVFFAVCVPLLLVKGGDVVDLSRYTFH